MKKNNLKFNILLIITFICLAVIITPKVLQNDTFYTIKVGEKIIENGIDMKEHFTYHENFSYTYPHWLYDVGVFLIYDLFDFPGLYITTIIFSFILLFTMYKTTNNIIKDKGISYMLVFLLSFLLRNYIAVRAQLISYILLLLIIYFIEKLKETNKKRYTAFIFISSILIANIHAAVWPMIFILFLPFLISDLIYFIKNKYKKTLKNRKEKYELFDNRIEIEKSKNTKTLIITFLLSIITGFLTPNFLTPFTYLIKSKMGITMKYISEHQPTNINDNPIFFIIIGIFIFILLQSKIKIKLRDLFMFAGLTLLTLLSKRSYAFFIIFLIYTFGRIISNLFKTRGKINATMYILSPVIYITLIALLLSTTYTIFKHENKKDYINEKKYPVELTNYIKKNLDIDKIRIYNGYNYGSYLLFNDIKVFIDSRADVYDIEFNKNSEVFNDNVKIFNNYEEVFDKYKITHVIINNTNKLKRLLDKDINYNEIYSDNYFTLYENLLTK